VQVSKYRSKSYRYATATAGGLKRTDIERKPYVQPYRRRKGSVVGDTMASAEHEPTTGVWGQSPQRGPGAEPLVRGSGGLRPLKLKAFWSLDVQRSRQI